MSSSVQTWQLLHDSRTHRVTASSDFNHVVEWYVDDELVATKKSMDSNIELSPGDGLGPDRSNLEEEDRAELDAQGLGAIKVRFAVLGTPRRATLFAERSRSTATMKALVGSGGIDLIPESGSRAAAFEQSMREHPVRATLLHTGGGVAKVIGPLILAAILARLAMQIPWPDWNLPDIAWPHIDLPSIPWPDINLPAIPWPDWQLPAWLRWIVDHLKYVLPIIIGFLYARREIRRRREQDALRASRSDGAKTTSDPLSDPSADPSADPPANPSADPTADPNGPGPAPSGP